MAPHRKGGQSQYVETPLLDSSTVFDEALRWALSNLATEITIDDLATRSHMSRRTFDRRFRNTHGCSAKQWITTQRVNLAKAALEQNQLSVERVAQVSGFENANVLRHHFRNNLGISPRQYRDQFSSLTNHSG
jgi:AraC family transcriptional activator FtrA